MSEPALNTDRELWRSNSDCYSDRVVVTEGGGIGMHAAYGRVRVMSVGQWHYLADEVDRLKAGYASFPTDVALVICRMGDGESVPSAASISSETGVTEKRVKEIQRSLKVLGLARFGMLRDGESEKYIARGSGYWLSRNGDDLATGLYASGIETEGHDRADGHGAEHESPVGEAETPILGSPPPNKSVSMMGGEE